MSTCSACGAPFECGMADGPLSMPCWCTRLPTLPQEAYVSNASGGASTCFCPECLRALIDRTQQHSAASG